MLFCCFNKLQLHCEKAISACAWPRQKKYVLLSVLTILISFCAFYSTAQVQKKFLLYLFPQFTNTISDATLGNNPRAWGIGLDGIYNNKTMFKPMLELSYNFFFYDDDVLRYLPSGEILESINGWTSLLAGLSVQPIREVFVSFLAGPSFINGVTLWEIKPAAGFCFPKNERWQARFSYNKVFKRENNQDFTSWSISLGIRLF